MIISCTTGVSLTFLIWVQLTFVASFVQHCATPLMFSRWNTHDECASLLTARSCIEQLGASHAPATRRCDDVSAQSVSSASVTVPILPFTTSFVPTTSVAASIPVSSQTQAITSVDMDYSPRIASSALPVALPVPAGSGLAGGGVGAAEKQNEWCVLRGESLVSLPLDPLPPLPSGVTESKYAEWGGVFNTGEFFHCHEPAIGTALGRDLARCGECRQELMRSLRRKVDLLLASARTFASFMAALEQCLFTVEEVVASQSDLLDGLWTVVHGSSAHVSSVERDALVVPRACSWVDLIHRAVHWRVSESCLRFLFDKSQEECRAEDLFDVRVSALSLRHSGACRVMLDRGMIGLSSKYKRHPLRALCAMASSNESWLIDCQPLCDFGWREYAPACVEAGMLYAAALHGRVETLPLLLLARGESFLVPEDIRSRYIRDSSVLDRALACACLSGKLDAVQKLIKFRAGRHQAFSDLHSAFDSMTCAVLGGSLKVAAHIFQLSRAVYGSTTREFFTAALVAAARTGRCDMIALLLDQGVAVNAWDWRSPVST